MTIICGDAITELYRDSVLTKGVQKLYFYREKYNAIREKVAKKSNRPKITLKAAKIIAIQEFGSAVGLTAHENNNANYQCYEMKMGNHTVIISNDCDYWGIACISFCDTRIYYNVDSLTENIKITEYERRRERDKVIRDAVIYNSGYMIKALLEEHGLETCRHMIDEAAKKLHT